MKATENERGGISGDLVPTSFRQAAKLRLYRDYQAMNAFRPLVFFLRINGNIDGNLLRRSLTIVVRRHSSLRSYFPHARYSVDDAFYVSPAEVDWEMRFQNLRDIASDAAASAERALLTDLQRPFPPDTFPLYRSVLVEHSDHTKLGIAFSHLIIDGESVDVFLADLSEVVRELRSGKDETEISTQQSDYSKFVRHESNWLSSSEAQRALELWSRTWKGVGPYPLLRLPKTKSHGDRVGRSVWQGKFNRTSVLRQLSQHKGGHFSLFMLCVSAMSLAVRDTTGQESSGFLYLDSRRLTAPDEKVIGYLCNKAMIRLDTSPNMWLGDALGSARSNFLAGLRHGMMPWELLVDELSPEDADLPKLPGLHMRLNVEAEPAEIVLDGMTTELVWPNEDEVYEHLVLEVADCAATDKISVTCGFPEHEVDRSTVEDLMGKFNEHFSVETLELAGEQRR